MEDNIKPVQISAKIIEAKLIGFSTTRLADDLIEPISVDLYEFLNEIAYTVIRDEKQVIADVKVTILNKDSKEVLATIETKTILVIENIIQDGDNMEIMPFAFMMAASTAIGNTRGMLTIVASQSKVSNAVLPLVDVSKLMPKEFSNFKPA